MENCVLTSLFDVVKVWTFSVHSYSYSISSVIPSGNNILIIYIPSGNHATPFIIILLVIYSYLHGV